MAGYKKFQHKLGSTLAIIKNYFLSKLMLKLLLIIAILGVVYPLGLPARSLKRSTHCTHTVSKNGRCGAAFTKTRCGYNAKVPVYCSRWGWCGTSALHKSTHQSAFDGRRCNVASRVVKRVVKRIVRKGKKLIKRGKKFVKRVGKKITKKMNYFTKFQNVNEQL